MSSSSNNNNGAKLGYLLGRTTLNINEAKQLFKNTTSSFPCNTSTSLCGIIGGMCPPADQRIHLNGPYVSLRRIQKHYELGQRDIQLQNRRCALRCLLKADTMTYQQELLKTGQTLLPIENTFW